MYHSRNNMEDLTYHEIYQRISFEFGYFSYLPSLVGLLLILGLFYIKSLDYSSSLIRIVISILYIYTVVVYCNWMQGFICILYSILLLVDLESIRNWESPLNIKHFKYAHSSIALSLPGVLLVTVFLPGVNYFPAPHILSAYSYCILSRLQLITKGGKKSTTRKAQVKNI
jgi:hypothetical protein